MCLISSNSDVFGISLVGSKSKYFLNHFLTTSKQFFDIIGVDTDTAVVSQLWRVRDQTPFVKRQSPSTAWQAVGETL
jgi:hypothetical protein